VLSASHEPLGDLSFDLQARERAKTADPPTKQDFLDMERRWASLAHSYEFAERLSNFMDEVKRRQAKR
jgi:hypothetical protein